MPLYLLINGAPARTPKQLLDHLNRLNISHSTISHTPLYTVEDAKHHRPISSGAHTKNLFVKNKKGQMWLLTLAENQKIDLNRTAKHLGAGNFSFAKPELLMAYLGIITGAVSPFALINDHGLKVQLVLDKSLTEHNHLHFHPLDRCQTTRIKSNALSIFLDDIGHPPILLDFKHLLITS